MFGLFTHGFVRTVSRSLAQCELTHAPRQPFDLKLARRQHDDYVAALEAAGLAITILPEAPELPDAMFVEDTAVILDELAILTRPGALSRRPEVGLIAPAIAAVRRISEICAPGTLEGGDVLRVGRTLFVGRSSRTNAEGIRQLAEIVAPYGYAVRPVAVQGCLHLKSAITAIAPGLLLAHPLWIEVTAFRHYEILSIDPTELSAANALAVNGRVFVVASAPRTAERLSDRGLDVRRLDVSELQKAESGLTCSSLLYSEPAAKERRG
ncbi:MAG: arginine deiminase family protein [Opitutaceae bacterium]